MTWHCPNGYNLRSVATEVDKTVLVPKCCTCSTKTFACFSRHVTYPLRLELKDKNTKQNCFFHITTGRHANYCSQCVLLLKLWKQLFRYLLSTVNLLMFVTAAAAAVATAAAAAVSACLYRQQCDSRSERG